MSITKEDVRHVAKLAALRLTDEEVDLRVRELGDILEYVDKLSSLSTRGILPTSHVHGVVNAFREDIVEESLPIEEVKALAPEVSGDSLRVPKII